MVVLDLDSVRVGVRAIFLNKWLSEGEDGSCSAALLDAGTGAIGLMRFLLGAEEMCKFEYHDFKANSFMDKALLRFNVVVVVSVLFMLDIFVYMSK